MPNQQKVSELLIARPWPVRGGFFLCGALTMLSFAPFGWYPLALFFIAPLLASFPILKPRQAAQVGFAYGAGLFSPETTFEVFADRFHGNDERIDVESLGLTTQLWLGVIDTFWNYTG